MNDKKHLHNSYLNLTGFPNGRVLTIMQNDKTELGFELKDINGELVQLDETVGQVQLVDSNRDTLVAISTANISGGKATFFIDKILEPNDYELYIKVGEQYFPSTSDSFIVRVIPSYDVMGEGELPLNEPQTIDIVVDALKDDVVLALTGQIEEAVLAVVNSDIEKFRGEKGDKFTIHDFTEEEWASLKGEDGNSLTFDQLDTDQQEALRGHSAYQVALNEGFEGSPEEWFESLKGDKGDTGDSAYEEALKNGFEGSEAEWLESLNGLDGTVAYSDLDESQKTALRVPPKVYTRDEYNQLAVKDANTLYFITDTPLTP